MRPTEAIGVLDRAGFESLLTAGRPHTYDLIYRLYNILPERLRNLNEKYRTAFNALRLFLEGSGHKSATPKEMEIALRPKGDLLPAVTTEEALGVFRPRVVEAAQRVEGHLRPPAQDLHGGVVCAPAGAQGPFVDPFNNGSVLSTEAAGEHFEAHFALAGFAK